LERSEMSNTLADTLFALAKSTGKGSWDDRARANANLRNALIVNLPAILAALREREGLRAALKEITKIKAEPIGDSGFQTGPQAHFLAAQRIARQALSGGGDA
jgi:hypothetical protein